MLCAFLFGNFAQSRLMEASNLITLSSTYVDLQGDVVPLESLEDLARQINGRTKGRLLIDHRRDIPPYGYWGQAIIVQEKGYHLLKARQFLYNPPSLLQTHPDLLIAELDAPQELALHPTPEKPTIIIDKNNYPSFEVAQALAHSLERDFGDMAVEMDTRKNLQLDPQISIVLSDYWYLLYLTLVPFARKIGDVILEETIGEAYKSLKERAANQIRQFISIIRKTRKDTVTHGKTQIVIFEISGSPYIELFTKTNDVDLIARSLKPGKLAKVHTRINELSKSLNLKEAHFILDKEGIWKFSYIITKEGHIVGTKDAMKKRDKLITRIQLNGAMGYSISGRVKYKDKLPPGQDNSNPA